MARHIDRQELATVIRNLQGITDEQKSALLELLNEKKKYGLVWENHQENAEDLLREQIPVLKEVTERRIISEDKDAPNHIIIEGDNLHALTSLCYTHEGKIDVIYIDPPYNTGNKDFVYNDSYVDAEDGYRHSKWLSFMEKRLRIAHRLLSDKGVIFISIDDNEQANLKLLCDEVFGSNNFISNFIWKSTPGSNTGNEIKTVTEYILLYTKTIDHFIANTRIIDDTSKYVLEDEYKNRRGKFVFNKLDRRMTGSHYSDALNYSIEMPDGTMLYPGSKEEKQEHWNWRWSKQKVVWGIENGFITFKKNKGFWAAYFKQYQYVDNNDNLINRTLPYQNLLDDDDSFNSARGSADLLHILNAKKFDYPKPMTLVKRTLEIATKETSHILDFFAGSGTTMHATMQLNAEDGGHRQCILVTNNENNICEEVTYERNRRVINGYTTPKGIEVEGLHSNNLRYYRTEFLPREKSNADKLDLVKAATDLLCIKENIYDEVAVTVQGRTVRKDFVRRFADGDREMMVIYEPRLISRIVEELKMREVKLPIQVYVFCDGQYAYTDDFREVLDKVNLCAFPDAIYQAYSKVLPPKKPQGNFAVEASEDEIREALDEADNYSYKSDESEEL